MQAGEYHYRTMARARLVLAAAVAAALFAGGFCLVQWQAGRSSVVVAAAMVAAIGLGAAGVYAATAGLWFEYRLVWRFREVCQQKGLVQKTAKGVVLMPRIGRLVGNRGGFRAEVRPLLGQSLADWERAAPAFALAYGKSATRVRDAGNGRVTLLVGFQSMPAHDFEHQAADISAASWRERLELVSVAKREGGGEFRLPLIDSHVLIAGITGAGKGSVLWSLILRLLPAHRAGVVQFWGFDPKQIELAIGRQFFDDRYAASPEEAVQLLERAHAEMQRRAAQLAGRQRRFEPSSEHPLHVLIIDELGYLSALLPDRKMRDQAERMMSALLVLGRAVGFCVIGALQDPRKETLSFRDLFPTRVAMRLPKPMVDLVLGTGMYDAGAHCDAIPARGAGAGVAFVVDEASTLPVCVRMPWCSDDMIRSAAAGRLDAVPGLADVPAPVLATVHQLHAS